MSLHASERLGESSKVDYTKLKINIAMTRIMTMLMFRLVKSTFVTSLRGLLVCKDMSVAVGEADQCLNGSQHHINSEWEVDAGEAAGAGMGMAVMVLPLLARRCEREKRYFRLNGSVRPSDWPRKIGRDQPWLGGLPTQKLRGSKSHYKRSAGGHAEGVS